MEKPKVKVFLDVETSPEKVYVYERYEASIVGKVERSILLSIAWKIDDGPIQFKCLKDFKTRGIHDDKPLTKFCWKLLNEADIVIAHNGNSFDIKKLNTFFILHGLKPYHKIKTVDTLKVARRHFKFFGNSLDDLAEAFGLGRKLEHSKGLQISCLKGSSKAYKEMKRYNVRDVKILYDLYKIFLPWIENHPHVNPAKHGSCANCGGRLQSRGTETTIRGVLHKYHCTKCGKWTSGKPIKVL